jgi:uncharacterized protein (TIGR03643 family)
MPQTPKILEAMAEREGPFSADPTPEQLAEFFILTSSDFKLIRSCRHNHTRLGMAVQLCTLKFSSTFPTDVTRVPASVIETLKMQLKLENVALERYQMSEQTRLDHQVQISQRLGYRYFSGVPFIRTARLLLSKLFVANERTDVLLGLVNEELVRHKVVLPGPTTILKLISRARERAAQQLHRLIAKRLSNAQSERLMALFDKGEETRTRLERLRTEPMYSSSVTLQAALERIERICEIGVGGVNLEDIAENRLAAVLRHGLIVRAADLEKYGHSRRLTTLLIVMQHLERSATDDALVVFDQVMQKIGLRGQRRRHRERLRSLKDLDAAALTLRLTLNQITQILADQTISASKARAAALEHLNASRLLTALMQVSDLASPAEDLEVEIWDSAHRSISSFIIPLLTTIKFEGGTTVAGLLEADTPILFGMEFSPEDTDRIIMMAWEDRTPFEAIEAQFGLKEKDVKALMRQVQSKKTYIRWRERVEGRITKLGKVRSKEVQRHKSDRQKF